MEIKNLKQRSKQWYAHRIKYVNATEIASITNNDKYRSINQLIHDKLFGTSFTGNKYTDYGILMEPQAKQFFETLTKYKFDPTIFIDDTETFSASLDGYNAETNTILEIKAPFTDENKRVSKSWDNFLTNREIPINYYSQIQCQLYCSKAKLAYFLVYFSETNYYIEKVYLNPEFIQTMLKCTKKYLEFYQLVKTELLNTTFVKLLAKKNI
ncbi:MAG: lambda-exonuclease family protein [Candidatus Phytoplasma pyri]